jgi:hypothetical protein
MDQRGTILRNSARCLACGDHLESRDQHEGVTCRCGNLTVDGGTAYRRHVWRNEAEVEETSILTPATGEQAGSP